MSKQYKPKIIKYVIDGVKYETKVKTKRGLERVYNKLVKQHNAKLEEQNKSQYQYGSAKGKSMPHLLSQTRYMAGVSRRGYMGMSTGRYKRYLEERVADAIKNIPPEMEDEFPELVNLSMLLEEMSDYAFERFYDYIENNDKVNKASLFELRTFYQGAGDSLMEKAEMLLDAFREFGETLKSNSPIKELIDYYTL